MIPAKPSNYRRILGIRFFIGSPQEAVQMGLRGGLVIFPSAPCLVEMERDAGYCEAALNCDLALTDSGFMVLIWNLLNSERLVRVSGLEYLKLLVAQPSLHESKATLWVMPSKQACDKAITWLRAQGVACDLDDFYISPIYPRDHVIDERLLELIKARRPQHIVLAVGGGIQEKLGLYLKREAGYLPGIHCIGAAIGFLSGDQVNIPAWADRFFLGWFFRCLSQPSRFFPRYWKARRLFPILLKYRENIPAPQIA